VTIVARLQAAGWETYLVGGVVRDLLLGRPPSDLDIVTAAPVDALAAMFPKTIPVGVAFGVTAVVVDGHAYQVATFRREGPYRDGRRPSFVRPAGAAADTLRRDFTMNALLYDPIVDRVIDHAGGRADLARRVIRTVGDPAPRFAEDHLRMLRAARFAAELGFTIDPRTEKAMTALAPQIQAVSQERIREELVRLLVAPGRAEGVRILARTGLLAACLPEVAALAAPPPGGGPATPSRLTLTLLALEHLSHPRVVLAVATLFALVDGPRQPGALCRRLRFSAADCRAITALVRERARVPDLPSMQAGVLRALLRRVDAADLLEIHRVYVAAGAEERATYVRAAEILAGHAGTRTRPARLLTGDDLIRLGFQPGPEFARLLDAVDAARDRREISTPAEAREWVRAHVAAGPSSRAAEASPGPDSSRDDGG
jgi:poly(A) polymerase